MVSDFDLIGVANMAGNPGRNKDVTRGAIRINRHTKGLILAWLSGWDLAQLGAECRYNRFIIPGYQLIHDNTTALIEIFISSI